MNAYFTISLYCQVYLKKVMWYVLILHVHVFIFFFVCRERAI